jgi:hypothetical protein
LEQLPGLFVTATIQGLPALIALIAWSEGGYRIFRQFGARMLWELAAGVVVAIGALLYLTLELVPGDAPHFALIAVTALCTVPLVTVVVHRVPVNTPRLRLALAVGVSFLSLQLGAISGVGLYVMLWQSPS